MTTTIRISLILVVVFFVSNTLAFAEVRNLYNIMPQHIAVMDYSNEVWFGADKQPAETCQFWHWSFRFDASTTKGVNMLSALLMAKAAGTAINIKYNVSSTPGTDQTSGCTGATISEVRMLMVP